MQYKNAQSYILQYSKVNFTISVGRESDSIQEFGGDTAILRPRLRDLVFLLSTPAPSHLLKASSLVKYGSLVKHTC